MVMKGVIKPDHIPSNSFLFKVPLFGTFTAISFGSLEEELQSIVLPDRTAASGGDSNPIETDIALPAHHIKEQALMEVWFKEGKHPITPSYKKECLLAMISGTGNYAKIFELHGVFVKKRVTPDLEMENEGEAVNITWTISIDEIFPVS